MRIEETLARELGISQAQARGAVALLDEGKTVPFIARYRKEQTGSLDDQTLRALETRLGALRGLEKRAAEIRAALDVQGALTKELSAGLDAASSLAELEDFAKSRCARMQQFFVVDDLKYLHKGGRISGGARLAGTLLQVKPILRGDEEGKIVVYDKVRGKKKALEALAEIYDKTVDDRKAFIGIAHADAPADALHLQNLLRDRGAAGEIVHVCYEPVTGAHVGPGTVALFFYSEAWR